MIEEGVELDIKEINSQLEKNKNSFEKGPIQVKYFGLEKGESPENLPKDQKFVGNITNGQFSYTGSLNENFLRSGLGLNCYANGDNYLGQWKENQKDGHGLYIHHPEKEGGVQIYSGYWVGG